jgi:hypothetical protein
MKEEAMRILQASKGRKVKDQCKEKVEFLEKRKQITNFDQDETVICWLQGVLKGYYFKGKENLESLNEGLGWIM